MNFAPPLSQQETADRLDVLERRCGPQSSEFVPPTERPWNFGGTPEGSEPVDHAELRQSAGSPFGDREAVPLGNYTHLHSPPPPRRMRFPNRARMGLKLPEMRNDGWRVRMVVVCFGRPAMGVGVRRRVDCVWRMVGKVLRFGNVRMVREDVFLAFATAGSRSSVRSVRLVCQRFALVSAKTDSDALRRGVGKLT